MQVIDEFTHDAIYHVVRVCNFVLYCMFSSVHYHIIMQACLFFLQMVDIIWLINVAARQVLYESLLRIVVYCFVCFINLN